MTVLITGANRGIGLEFARAYAARGETVLGTARNPEAATELCEVAEVLPCDVSSDASVQALGEALGNRTIDLLINNAGILRVDTLDAVDTETMLAQYNTNAVGILRVTATLRDNLSDRARVVNVTSRMGSIEDNTSGRMYGYRASKAAVNMITKGLSLDLAPIPVMAIHPGYVRTDMTSGSGDISPKDAVARMLTVIDELDESRTGMFWHRDGYELPW